MSIARHNPPGFVKDLNDENLREWSDVISSFMNTTRVSPKLTPQFYDATKVAEKGAQNAKVTWTGFPRQVKRDKPNDQERWYVADSDRGKQDEYLEWSVRRNNDGKITKIVFCNEGPEYFEFLAETQPDTLLQLYKDLNPGVSIQNSDLYNPDGTYNPVNKWNKSTDTGTIMHLIQQANTLGAEIDLGARATVVRKDSKGIITDMDQLIRCSNYGNYDRNSDPHIGIAVNSAARGGKGDLSMANQVTIADPVGLYIDSVDWGMVEPPVGHEGDNPQDFWKWTRGTKGHYMRGEFEVPADKGYVVGDMLVNGEPLNYGSQLADYIQVSITARYFPLSYTPTPQTCPPPRPHKFETSNVNMNPDEQGGDAKRATFSGLDKYTGQRGDGDVSACPK